MRKTKNGLKNRNFGSNNLKVSKNFFFSFSQIFYGSFQDFWEDFYKMLLIELNNFLKNHSSTSNFVKKAKKQD